MIKHTTTHTLFSKKIDREGIAKARIHYDKTIIPSQDGVIFIEPLSHIPNYNVAQRLVCADFFARQKSLLSYIVCNPSLHHIESSDPDILLQIRQDITSKTKKLLDFLSITYEQPIVSMSHIPYTHRLHELTSNLFERNLLSYRRDVCYYNIYTNTVVPDHRVHYLIKESYRYYIRFFIDSKKDTLIAYIDNPSLLFGCVAILVNPLDKRYKRFIGKNVLIPLINKNIPVVAHTSVSIEGFGVHMLVPAHNRDDFHIALELGLPYDVYAVDKFGKFTSVAKEFQGKHKDEFESNIIQFIDDISNLEKKELISLGRPVDSLTGDTLLPLLQKNIYISLTDGSLEDKSLLSIPSFVGDDSHLQSQIERDEWRCISTSDLSQPSLPFVVDEYGSLQEDRIGDKSLIYCILRDLVLLNVLHLPAQSDVIVQSLCLQIDGKLLGQHLLDLYRNAFDISEINELYRLISLLADDSQTQQYLSSIENILHILDATEGVLFTQQGYVLKSYIFPYQYDHEYTSISLFQSIVDDAKKSHITYFYSEKNSDWIKYILYLYRIIHKNVMNSATFIKVPDKIPSVELSSLESYPGDVVRLLLLSTIQIGDEEVTNNYSPEYFYRFINKRWNASRLLWGGLNKDSDLSLQGLHISFNAHISNFSDYDTRIFTKLRYIWEETKYYNDKKSVSTVLKFMIDSIRYDISEYTLFINKYHTSDSTLFVSRLSVIVSLHILYPFAPSVVLGMCSLLHITLQPNLISEFFDNHPVQKNYKCTMMMDVIHQWAILLQEHTADSSYTLILQSNKDFSNYMEQNRDFILQYFGGDDTKNILFLSEGDLFPENSIIKDLLTMKVAILIKKVGIPISEVNSVSSLAVLQGQLEYKKQLQQTMRNTIMRLRSSVGNTETIIQLQKDVDDIVKSIEVLEYQISKLKYF